MGKAVAAISHGDFGHQAQMAGDEPVRGVVVAMLAPTLGKRIAMVAVRAMHNAL
jgi:hypothetical protein